MTNWLPSPQEAAQKLQRRRRARKSVAAFAQEIDVPGRPLSDAEDEWRFEEIETQIASHHFLLLETLDRVFASDIKQLMVFMPPGSAKSTYASVVYPTYVMGRSPGSRIILASYASPIAWKQSRRARHIVTSSKFNRLFETGLADNQRSVESWAMGNGSEFMAGGILAGMTGNRATDLLIDDPVAGREEADSETVRRNTREAYEDDLTTRLMPGGSTIIIQTRWHQDDLSGGILPKDWAGESGMLRGRDGLDWFVLCLPAEADRADDPLGREIGQPLWPEWFSTEHFARYKANRRTWGALYQQKPTDAEGDYFQAQWLRYWDTKPEQLRIYAATDGAVTDKRDSAGDPDYTEHGIVGMDPHGRLFILDWWRGQTTSDVWIDAMLDLAEKWKPLLWFGESGVIRRAVEPSLARRMRERGPKSFQVLRWLPSIVDKEARARSIQGRYSMGMVYHPAPSVLAGWKTEPAGCISSLERQLLSFPNAVHDDGVDVLSLFGRGIDSILDAEEEKKREQRVVTPGSIEWLMARTKDEPVRSKYRS